MAQMLPVIQNTKKNDRKVAPITERNLPMTRMINGLRFFLT